MWAKRLACYRTMGDAYIIYDTVVKAEGDAVMVARFETVTQAHGDPSLYWKIRRRYELTQQSLLNLYD